MKKIRNSIGIKKIALETIKQCNPSDIFKVGGIIDYHIKNSPNYIPIDVDEGLWLCPWGIKLNIKKRKLRINIRISDDNNIKIKDIPLSKLEIEELLLVLL
jgi:hypothetical protein